MTLKELSDIVEQANSDPANSLTTMKMLIERIEVVMANLYGDGRMLGRDVTEDMYQTVIETFLQNTQILIDNSNEGSQQSMLAILSKLSTIRWENLGL